MKSRTFPGRAFGHLKAVGLGLLLGGLLGLIFISTVEKFLQLRSSNPETRSSSRHDRDERGLGSLPSSTQDQRQTSAEDSDQWQHTIHTFCTSNGSPYLNFQTRIMYGTYKLIQGMPGGENMVAFTRILHRTTPDLLMSEVPTFRAEPLTPTCDTWCEFPVSDRPNAVAQFFQAAEADPDLIKAPWILMLEGDYVWMKPMLAPRADSDSPSWAFPYDYIVPEAPNLQSVMRLMYKEGPLSDIPNSGPAPVLMRAEEWRRVIPDWERLTAHIEEHKETKDALGWVREMYAWSVAAALQGIKLELKSPGESPLIAQPPNDKHLGNASMFHYTWGVIVEDSSKNKRWGFDKREYIASDLEHKVPLIPLPPLFEEGLKLHEGQAFTSQLHETVLGMLKQMNRAILELPTL